MGSVRGYAGLHRLADIVVMPSASEGQARVYLEAQACARVLLASDIPAAREVVDDGRTGLLYRAGDVGHLTEQLVRAARDPDLRSAIGRRARDRVQMHDMGAILRVYARFLAQIVATEAA